MIGFAFSRQITLKNLLKMKTTILLSTCILASGGFLLTRNIEKPATKISYTGTTYFARTLKSKRSFSSKPIAPVYILVDKRKYELSVYDAQGWFATYPVVFGNNTLDDKKMEGDRNTPEGSFKIANKRIHDKWDRYMGLDYPTKESLERFALRKQRGEVPSWAKPGGGVGIHGTWPDDDYVVDNYKNWTNGCISLKRSDVEDLYSFLPIGTPVTINK